MKKSILALARHSAAKYVGLSALVLASAVAMTPAQALPIPIGTISGAGAEGLTYSLTASGPLTSSSDTFTLSITGINGAGDLEGGRSGVVAFALGNPANFSSAVAPSGFNTDNGLFNGLSQNGGCSAGNNANFYCFQANSTPSDTPALPANDSLSFTFTVDLSSGNFVGYDPAFKIDWAGCKVGPRKCNDNYNLVSLDFVPGGPPSVPEPTTLVLFAAGLAGLGFAAARRRRQSVR